MKKLIITIVGMICLTSCLPNNNSPLTFETYEINADGATEEGVPAELSIKFDIPTKENNMQETIIENYKQLIEQSEVGKELNMSLDGTLQDIAKAYSDYFPKGIEKGELDPAFYILRIESGYQTDHSVNFMVSSGIFSNGGPYENIVVMNRYDGKFLRTEDMMQISNDDVIRLAQEHAKEFEVNPYDLIEGYYQIVPDSAGCLLHYLIGSHLFGEIRMPVSSVEPYLTDAGKEVFGLVQPGWWERTTRKVSPITRYILYGLGGILIIILLLYWGQKQSEKETRARYERERAETERLRQAADNGDAQACAELAERYINGLGTARNYKTAIELAKKSLDSGNGNAKVILGSAYFEQAKQYMENADMQKAVEFYRLSTQYGESRAYHNLAVCYFQGKGVTQNLHKGLELAKKAYDMGNKNVCGTIASYYRNPDFGINDHVTGHKWDMIGAKAGNTLCQIRVAFDYEDGTGVQINIGEAYKWFKIIADDINAPADKRGVACWKYGTWIGGTGAIEEGKRYIKTAQRLKNKNALKYGDGYLKIK